MSVGRTGRPGMCAGGAGSSWHGWSSPGCSWCSQVSQFAGWPDPAGAPTAPAGSPAPSLSPGEGSCQALARCCWSLPVFHLSQGIEKPLCKKTRGCSRDMPVQEPGKLRGLPSGCRSWREEEEEAIGIHSAASPPDLTPLICTDRSLMRCVKQSIYLQLCK